MSRVLIADDHAVVRAGYKQFLEAEPLITEIGEAASGSETLDALRTKDWDLLLMDIHMPDRSGLDILKSRHLGLSGRAGTDHERLTGGTIRAQCAARRRQRLFIQRRLTG